MVSAGHTRRSDNGDVDGSDPDPSITETDVSTMFVGVVSLDDEL